MESTLLRDALRRAVSLPQRTRHLQHSRCLATLNKPPKKQDPIRAAAPINFTGDRNQFARPRGRGSNATERSSRDAETASQKLLQRVRIVPASPSYFTGFPRYTDDLLYLSSLVRRHQTLPVLPNSDAPRVYWKTHDQYKADIAEPVRVRAYTELISMLKRLNCIHPSVIPAEVVNAMTRYKRAVQPSARDGKLLTPDKQGFAPGVGRRKSSVAKVFLVEGDGQCRVNGKVITEYFGRVHDRESALWALKATARMGKYNVWALVHGGGTTGQAEAITLGLAKALLIHEPDLKPALRGAGVVTRNPKRVERKKAGHLKARKMPAWVKR